MIMRNPYTGELYVEREVVHISSKYKYKYKKRTIFYDDQNGIYWEVYPKIIDEDFMIQKGLCKKIKAKAVAYVEFVSMYSIIVELDALIGKPSKLPTIKRKFLGGAIGNWSRKFWKWA